MSADLTLIPASAGSGKTFKLTKMLCEGILDDVWEVNDELPQGDRRSLQRALRAERVVAVTFTEVAAAELRQRVRGALMADGRLEQAAALDEAYVSTIHGFGLRILREAAFELGLALNPRLLKEEEQQQLIRQALGGSALISPVSKDLAKFGYRYDYNTGASAEDGFRSHLLQVIEFLRTIGDDDNLEQIIQNARAWTASQYGTLDPNSGEELAKMLKRRVAALLDTYPMSLADQVQGNKSAKGDFQKDYDALKAAVSGDKLLIDWDLWAKLSQLRLSAQKFSVPDEYKALAESVIEVASLLERHPGPLAFAQGHIEMMFRIASDAMCKFDSFKRDAGLLDYSDMVVGAYRALLDPQIAQQLRDRIDCVVVDEFQDTNPMQFGLLWQLIRQQPPTVIVGDIKQSIMGFQGADPRLFNALNQGAPLSVHPLGRNWRSQPALLEFINAVSQTLFEDYQTLEAKGKPSKLDALHVLVTPDQPKTKSHPWRAERVASALKAKLEDPSYLITDRNTEEERRVRGGDCAVLCPTHSMLEHYAEALRKQGLRVRLQQSGWLESSELMITMEALSLLHDPQNLHARLYLSVTALGHHTLQDALKKLVAGETLVDPAFEKLLQLSESAGRATVDQIVPEALRVLGLYDAVTTWPDARQARANLLRLEGLAQEFVDAQPESLMAGGIHGYGLPQFMSWVRKRAESDNDMPAASVVDDNAIELVTWHACKGREWPIVAVCGMSQHVKARVPDLQLGYPHFDDLDQLIESAAIEFSPAFASPQASKRFLARLTPDREDQIRREIYVALTRPRDQLLLEWPLDAVSSESTTRASLLQDRAHIQINEVSVSVADVVELPAIIEHASLEPSPLCPIDAERAPSHGRRALRIRTYSGTSTPDSRSPSSGHDQAINDNLGQWDELKYAEPLDLPPHSDPLAVGEFVHRYFELDFDSQRVSQHLRDQAYKLWPNQAEWVCERLKIARKNFEVAIDAKFTPTSQAAEVPVIGMDHKGSVLNGIIDLLLHTSSGQVVIDHKTDRAAEMAVLVNRHAMQLEDYALMLGEGAVQALVIHAASAGRILIRHIA